MISQHFAEIKRALQNKDTFAVFTNEVKFSKPIVRRTVKPAGAGHGVVTPQVGAERTDLRACVHCSRRFTSDRIDLHEQICGRTAKKKRRVYDATKHRVGGTEMESYVAGKPGRKTGAKKPQVGAANTSKSSGGGAAKAGIVSNSNWRRTHEEFIAAIRSAKAAKTHLERGGKLSDLPPPPPSTYDDYVQCPHCNRRFNQSAAERHIPQCANYQHNKSKPAARSSRR